MKRTLLHHLLVLFQILEDCYPLPYLPKQSYKYRTALPSELVKYASWHGAAAGAQFYFVFFFFGETWRSKAARLINFDVLSFCWYVQQKASFPQPKILKVIMPQPASD